ncbi:ABC transporter ATP-binding protein [Microcella frigidaquae]|jgi:ABC-2 type transport system ATP-binding protein|uniref:ABC-2 type transport system ATP-binding protein n=1 Tax=Microcella frigidaquae TaxID=424758 RepID=A0A840XFI5_9MICO|nr:ABC transporter ATP-binding protein [Microcella frigidaquae]MBB5617272.1 ABC-2 type transport system ATP-binding protein [Microcella frigidaquae]NHN45029.1 ABC transporter ATP-binding protein [Microcella frigidaquae]
MTTIVEARGLTKRYRGITAVDGVDFQLARNTITGLLGRNGAGKTTLMHLLTGQEFATHGSITIAGESPVENPRVLQHTCFIKESQRYPDDFKPKHVFAAAPGFFPNWDADFARELAAELRLPVDRRIKKLSRGQLSSVGIIVGLASRAPITIFDEPYLGLDAIARQAFYDRLLADYAAHPRTIILSTHLIDEVADLLEHALVIDNGRILIDSPVDALRAHAATIAGPAEAVERAVAGLDVIHRERLGGFVSATVAGITEQVTASARAAGLEVGPVSLQQLIIRQTGGTPTEHEEVTR